MSDARKILAELQTAGLADPDLDYDTVVAELARGTPPMLVLHQSPRQGISTTVMSVRHAQLLDDLVAVARAPFLQAEPPHPPAIEWVRIADDLRRTAARSLHLVFRWEQYSDDGYWMCDISLDGTWHGGFGVDWDEADPEDSLSDVADRLCEGWLHEEVWGGWPMCPNHQTRPMWASVNDGRAAWLCEADPSDAVEIGRLGL